MIMPMYVAEKQVSKAWLIKKKKKKKNRKKIKSSTHCAFVFLKLRRKMLFSSFISPE